MCTGIKLIDKEVIYDPQKHVYIIFDKPIVCVF